MATEPIQSGPYPVPADPPDGPNQMSAIVMWAAGRLNMRFASAAARNAAIPTPVAGMECTIGSGTSQAKYIHDGTEWRHLYSDTGWVQIPAAQNGNAFARVRSDVLYLRGSFSTASGANWPAGVTTMGFIPQDMVPAGVTVTNTQTTGTGQNAGGVPSALQMWITPTGEIQCYSATAAVNTAMINALSGIPR